jgi:hypothetical protein
MAGVCHIPWYATGFRGDSMAADLAAVTALSMRYGATQYAVHRARDDRYKLLQMVWFESQKDWYRFWEGPEMIDFRSRHSSHYQVPVLYYWYDEIAAGALGPEVALEPAMPEPEPEPEPEVAS